MFETSSLVSAVLTAALGIFAYVGTIGGGWFDPNALMIAGILGAGSMLIDMFYPRVLASSGAPVL